MRDNILERLKTECPFPQVFEEWEHPERSWVDIPRRKIGHIRADYQRGWWCTVWPCHPELATKKITAEIDRVYDALTAKDALKDLSTLTRFCEAHQNARANPQFQQEYNFFLVRETCDFWIRLITRNRDYNLYLNAFAKEAAV